MQDLDSAQEATAPGGSGGRMAAAAHRELVHLPLIPQEFDAEAVEAWKLQREFLPDSFFTLPTPGLAYRALIGSILLGLPCCNFSEEKRQMSC